MNNKDFILVNTMGESIMSLKANGFEVKNIITWNKSNAMLNLTRRVLTHITEFVIWVVKGKGWISNYDKLKDNNFLLIIHKNLFICPNIERLQKDEK